SHLYRYTVSIYHQFETSISRDLKRSSSTSIGNDSGEQKEASDASETEEDPARGGPEPGLARGGGGRGAGHGPRRLRPWNPLPRARLRHDPADLRGHRARP